MFGQEQKILAGVDSSVQKNSDYGQNSDEIYGRKKCLILAFFQH
jgi:hypothetical protein